MNIRLIAPRDGLDLVAVYYKEAFIKQIIITTVVGRVLYVAKNYVAMIE